jgi:hypothetical protein
MKANALPPPPPDIFSNDALFNIPAFVKASPVPLAVPSQPPPAPPPITKCNLSIATELVVVAENNRIAENNTETILFKFFIIFSLSNLKNSVNYTQRFNATNNIIIQLIVDYNN